MKHTSEEIKNRLSNIGEAIGNIALDYIVDLEKENERLTVSYETLKLHDEEEIGMLKSENAELKGLVNQYKASKCGSISLVNRNMIMFDQLTKAKEIIKDLLSCLYSVEYDRLSDLEQAEQFIKDSEVNNALS